MGGLHFKFANLGYPRKSHLWEIENEQSYIGLLRVKLVLAFKRCKNEVQPLMNRTKLFFHSNSNTTSKHASHEEEIIVFYTKQPMENHSGPTPNKKPFELKNDSIATAASIGSFASHNMTIQSLRLIPFLEFCNDCLFNNKMCLMTLYGFLQ